MQQFLFSQRGFFHFMAWLFLFLLDLPSSYHKPCGKYFLQLQRKTAHFCKQSPERYVSVFWTFHTMVIGTKAHKSLPYRDINEETVQPLTGLHRTYIQITVLWDCPKRTFPFLTAPENIHVSCYPHKAPDESSWPAASYTALPRYCRSPQTAPPHPRLHAQCKVRG